MKCGVPAVVAIGALLVACGAENTSLELHTQEALTSEPAEQPPPAPAPSPSMASAARAPSDAGAPSQPQSAPPASACPLQCYIANGRQREPVAADDLAKLQSALASTMAAIHQCTAASRTDNPRKSPTVNLRFGPAGQLLDVGADPTGYDSDIADCMEAATRGGSAPSISFDGPGTVRCAEKCDRRQT